MLDYGYDTKNNKTLIGKDLIDLNSKDFKKFKIQTTSVDLS